MVYNDEKEQIRRTVFLPMYYTIISLMVIIQNKESKILKKKFPFRYHCHYGQLGVFIQSLSDTEHFFLTMKPGNRLLQVKIYLKNKIMFNPLFF